MNYFILVSIIAACSKGAIENGPNQSATSEATISITAKTSPLPNNDGDCPYGGILVETGFDKNGNGVLDAIEVDGSDKVCNDKPGSNGAVGL